MTVTKTGGKAAPLWVLVCSLPTLYPRIYRGSLNQVCYFYTGERQIACCFLVVKATNDKQKANKKEKVTAVSVEKIDLCLEMLKSADATDLNQGESETTKELEGEYVCAFKLVIACIMQKLVVLSFHGFMPLLLFSVKNLQLPHC